MNLPDKPSELIRIALSDLEKCERDDGYQINMNEWHHFDSRVCHVCLAGAVMAMRGGGVPQTSESCPSEFPKEEHKFYALEAFRCGNWANGLVLLKIDPWRFHEIKLPILMPKYIEDREGFFKTLHSVADVFEEIGL